MICLKECKSAKYISINDKNKDKTIKMNKNKKKLLLHSCCGPCSTTAIFSLAEEYDITICYYNPNIYPEEEYIKRKSEQLKLIKAINEEGNIFVNLLDAEYDCERFEDAVCSLQKEKEGGARCSVCFRLRLEKSGVAC